MTKQKEKKEEKQTITKNTSITDALYMNENAGEIFLEAGLGCIGCGLAQVETIEQGLAAHGYSPEQVDRVIEELNK